MQKLAELCGQRFQGVMTYLDDVEHDFADKFLVATVADCTDAQVKMPFQVGEDRSRTWMFSNTANGLELKHDHWHADCSDDDISNYGGLSAGPGTALSQSFPADDFTQACIPDASTNVWNVSVSSDGLELIYHLERHNKPRFTAVLKRVRGE